MPFKRKKKDNPEVSTASLPDIIFMLLFFFMTVTVLRTAASQVTIELPETQTAIKVNHEASEYNIYIGSDLDEENPNIVYDVKLLLRKHGLRKINYIVKKSKSV